MGTRPEAFASMNAALVTTNAAHASTNPAFLAPYAAFPALRQLTPYQSSGRFATGNAAFENTSAALLTPCNSPVLRRLPQPQRRAISKCLKIMGNLPQKAEGRES